ncbi:hypothetical protein MMC16_005540 [Acarospora aff. strigata]|nr:hypothetical protein [Acarospora aff. strigata]
MSDSQTRDAEAQRRIISHMNKDHHDSVVRFLEHYAHVSTYSARNAKLTGITLNKLTIDSGNGSQHVISLDPPLSSWPEARERMVTMDKVALQGLGRSHIAVKEYRWPTGFLALVFVLAAQTLATFWRRANFLPGSLLYDSVLRHVPRYAKFCYDIQPYLFYLMLAIHVTEAVWMARTRLVRYNVPQFSILWWKWVSSTFVEGVGAFKRFDQIVKEEVIKKEKAKH